ncbi:hypothetical protein OQA88_1963 [Cercophora sp. LCS_1]
MASSPGGGHAGGASSSGPGGGSGSGIGSGSRKPDPITGDEVLAFPTIDSSLGEIANTLHRLASTVDANSEESVSRRTGNGCPSIADVNAFTWELAQRSLTPDQIAIFKEFFDVKAGKVRDLAWQLLRFETGFDPVKHTRVLPGDEDVVEACRKIARTVKGWGGWKDFTAETVVYMDSISRGAHVPGEWRRAAGFVECLVVYSESREKAPGHPPYEKLHQCNDEISRELLTIKGLRETAVEKTYLEFKSVVQKWRWIEQSIEKLGGHAESLVAKLRTAEGTPVAFDKEVWLGSPSPRRRPRTVQDGEGRDVLLIDYSQPESAGFKAIIGIDYREVPDLNPAVASPDPPPDSRKTPPEKESETIDLIGDDDDVDMDDADDKSPAASRKRRRDKEDEGSKEKKRARIESSPEQIRKYHDTAASLAGTPREPRTYDIAAALTVAPGEPEAHDAATEANERIAQMRERAIRLAELQTIFRFFELAELDKEGNVTNFTTDEEGNITNLKGLWPIPKEKIPYQIIYAARLPYVPEWVGRDLVGDPVVDAEREEVRKTLLKELSLRPESHNGRVVWFPEIEKLEEWRKLAWGAFYQPPAPASSSAPEPLPLIRGAPVPLPTTVPASSSAPTPPPLIRGAPVLLPTTVPTPHTGAAAHPPADTAEVDQRDIAFDRSTACRWLGIDCIRDSSGGHADLWPPSIMSRPDGLFRLRGLPVPQGLPSRGPPTDSEKRRDRARVDILTDLGIEPRSDGDGRLIWFPQSSAPHIIKQWRAAAFGDEVEDPPPAVPHRLGSTTLGLASAPGGTTNTLGMGSGLSGLGSTPWGRVGFPPTAGEAKDYDDEDEESEEEEEEDEAPDPMPPSAPSKARRRPTKGTKKPPGKKKEKPTPKKTSVKKAPVTRRIRSLAAKGPIQSGDI